MPATLSNKMLAFVEGSLEKMFLNANFSYVHVITIGNGSGWSLDAVADDVIRKYKLQKWNPSYVIVWFDRESRIETSDFIATYISKKLNSEGIPLEKLIVVVPDRMIENVMLADTVAMQQEMKYEFEYPGNGCNGKNLLRKLYKEKKEINYKETFHGVSLLKKVRLERVRADVTGIDRLLKICPMDCWWFRD